MDGIDHGKDTSKSTGKGAIKDASEARQKVLKPLINVVRRCKHTWMTYSKTI